MKLKAEIQYKKTIAVSLILFIALGFMANSTEYLLGIDSGAIEYIQKSESATLLGIAKLLSFWGSIWGYMTMGVGVLLYSTRKGDSNIFRLYALTAIAAGASSQVLKRFYGRMRPLEFFRIEQYGFSFPSGHSMSAMAVYIVISFTLLKLFPRHKILICAFSGIMVALIGWSRLYLGVHWITDVAGGYLGGVTIALIILNLDFKKR